MSGFVGAQHEFHDAEFVRGWANCIVPTEPRLQLFDIILDEINIEDPTAAQNYACLVAKR